MCFLYWSTHLAACLCCSFWWHGWANLKFGAWVSELVRHSRFLWPDLIVVPFLSRTWVSHPTSMAISTQAGCFTGSPSVSYTGCACRTTLILAWVEFGCRPASGLCFWPRFENIKISWTITAFFILHSWLQKLQEGLLWQDFSQISTKSQTFSALVLT